MFVTGILALLLTGVDQAQEALELPPMGINVHYPSYYDNISYFTEATRHGSHWLSFTPESGDWSDERIIPQTVDGYPAQLAPDQGARMIIYLESTAAPAGDYTLTWAGDGTLRIVHDFAPLGTFSTADAPRQTVTIPERDMTHLFIEILATNPTDPVRDIRLWLPGFDENSPERFNPILLERLAPFEPIRLIDWGVINASTIRTWGQRAQEKWYTWAAEGTDFYQGVPFEVQVELGNVLGKDIWINVPHAVDDDFVRQLATLVRDQLDPSLRVWVEYTNEAWNPAFTQNYFIYEQSLAIVEAENVDEYYLYHHYGRRTADVLAIFEEVFAGQTERVIGVLAGQSGWAYPGEAALAEVARLGMMDLVDVYAIAPYVPNSAEDGVYNVDAVLAEMDLNALTDADYARIFEEFNRGVEAVFTGDGEYAVEMRGNRALAEQYGLPLITYEAGQHLTGYNLENFTVNQDLPLVYGQINARPEMYDSYIRYLDLWREFGGETMVMFHLAGIWSEVEAFGHLNAIDQPIEEAHKYRALVDWLAAQ
ncbi:MAG: hypothetical protein ACOCXZ_03040 [Chloroflexota bacterium]